MPIPVPRAEVAICRSVLLRPTQAEPWFS